MTTFAKLVGVGLLSSLAMASGLAPVSAGEAASVHVAPLKGLAMTVGSKRAVGYYVADAGKACNLTLMLADSYSDTDNNKAAEPVRVNLTIGAGTSARVETYQSNALAFWCAADATSMTVQPVLRVAYNAAAK